MGRQNAKLAHLCTVGQQRVSSARRRSSRTKQRACAQVSTSGEGTAWNTSLKMAAGYDSSAR